MAKSERVLLLAAALDLPVAVIDIIHAVNELHVVMAESSQSRGYEVSGSVVVSIPSGTIHVVGGNNIPLRGGDTVKIVFHNNFQDYIWVRMRNGEYQFMVDYLMDGKGPYYVAVDIYVNGELKASNVNALTHLCTYLFDSLSDISSWLGIASNAVDTTITIDVQDYEVNGYLAPCDTQPSFDPVARICGTRSCAKAYLAVDLAGVDESNSIIGANTDLGIIGDVVNAESNTDTEIVEIPGMEGGIATIKAAIATSVTTVGIG